MKLTLNPETGQILDEAGAVVAFPTFTAFHKRRPLVDLMVAAPELLAMVKQQHEAIDRLFARLIEVTSEQDELFLPSQSGQPWAACVAANALIKRLENGGG